MLSALGSVERKCPRWTFFFSAIFMSITAETSLLLLFFPGLRTCSRTSSAFGCFATKYSRFPRRVPLAIQWEECSEHNMHRREHYPSSQSRE